MIDGAPAIRHDTLLIFGFPVGSHVARRVYNINVTFFPLDFFFFKRTLVLSHLFTHTSESISSSGLVKLGKIVWEGPSFPTAHGKQESLNIWVPIFPGRSTESYIHVKDLP